ncbi:MAG: YihY/virulence factor BrkB family protein [Planctomycetota bacterium]
MRDIPHVYRHVGVWTFVKRIYKQSFFEDNLLVWAAALAYSWLLALFPFVIFSVSLVPLLPDRVKPSEDDILNAVEQALVTGVELPEAAEDDAEEVVKTNEDPVDSDLREPDGAVPTTLPATQPGPGEPTQPTSQDRQPAIISQTITSLVTELINEPPTTFQLVFSLSIALFLASNGVSMTMAGLDECYDVAPDKIRSVWINKPVAMLLTLTLAILILTTVIILPVGGEFISRAQVWLEEKATELPVSFGWLQVLSRILRWSIGLFLLLASVGILYRFGTSVRTRLHLFSPGTVFTVFMWIATAYGFKIYLTRLGAADSYAQTYGAVAGVAILMFLFYVDALFLLIGAEINAELDFIRLGIKSGPLPPEEQADVAPAYELDEEDLELKAELEERRSFNVKPGQSLDGSPSSS